MAENTSIEWTDHTWSPWEGCQKVGPGCDHCYAESMNKWLRKGENWGPGAPRRTYSDTHWLKPLKWDAAACAAGKTPKVFPSVCDPFDNAAPDGERERFFRMIEMTPHLIWLLLTKRIGNVKDMLPWRWAGALPANVWLGATVVNQEEADRDIPKLLATPAAVRFLSMEPLLGPVDLAQPRCCGNQIEFIDGDGWTSPRYGYKCCEEPVHLLDEIDWVIVGGESGPGARPMHPDWARGLRDQCAAAGVPFLFKQVGEAIPVETDVGDYGHEVHPLDDSLILPGDGYKLHTGPNAQYFVRLNKKLAGRLLDGVTHDGFPTP